MYIKKYQFLSVAAFMFENVWEDLSPSGSASDFYFDSDDEDSDIDNFVYIN